MGRRGLSAVKRCLVVEDSRVIRKVACRILESLAFEAEEAEDGAIALQICRKNMPDAILLDWNMPSMKGVEFLRALRSEPGGERPVVIFCTSENDLTRIAEVLGAGADNYLMKPFDRGDIAAKLAETGLV
jgi:two-component system chemotaxis response regulator CheY